MKWFKHISDSLDDPFIFDLISKHGADGYLVFFGILEIYAREIKPELSWNLCITLSYLKQKFHKTHKQLITNPLQTISNSGKWDVSINNDQVTIFIPKFKELMDEWTLRKLGSHSGVTPKILKTELEVELEVDKDIKKKIVKEKKPRKLPLTDEQYFDMLKKNKAYQGIDIEIQKAKCEAWCITNQKTFSRRRLINWLNRVDKPINFKQPDPIHIPKERPSDPWKDYEVKQ